MNVIFKMTAVLVNLTEELQVRKEVDVGHPVYHCEICRL